MIAHKLVYSYEMNGLTKQAQDRAENALAEKTFFIRIIFLLYF